MDSLAAVIVLFAGLWLIGLATAAIAKPELVKGFFGKFASSAFTHFLEMFLRIIVGTAFITYAHQMKFALVFMVFGWMLLLTAAVLLFVPEGEGCSQLCRRPSLHRHRSLKSQTEPPKSYKDSSQLWQSDRLYVFFLSEPRWESSAGIK
jgi:hypothetical protein